MSAEAALFVRAWRVGDFIVEMTMPPVVAGEVRSVVMEWSPHRPERLSREQHRQYQRGLRRAVAELTARTGMKALVVDV